MEFEQQVFSDDDMSFCNALYANDIPQTCFSKKSHPWNLRNLRSNLELCHTQFNNSPVEDVTRSFVYFGSPKSKFILHIENSNTYSINYLQSGAGKVWLVLIICIYTCIIVYILILNSGFFLLVYNKQVYHPSRRHGKTLGRFAGPVPRSNEELPHVLPTQNNIF